MPNSLFTIRPYEFAGTWVFDEPELGLHKEPFVSGAPEIIDQMVEAAGIPDAEQGFRLVFSAQEFPGYQIALERRDKEGSGYWYEETRTGMRGWLCPATLCFFPDGHPEELYARAESLSRKRAH